MPRSLPFYVEKFAIDFLPGILGTSLSSLDQSSNPGGPTDFK
jgi:hypothetical protein